jgi:hypothetical protein
LCIWKESTQKSYWYKHSDAYVAEFMRSLKQLAPAFFSVANDLTHKVAHDTGKILGKLPKTAKQHFVKKKK